MNQKKSKKKTSEEFKSFSIKLTTEYLGQYPDEASRYCKTKEKQIINIEKNFEKEIKAGERTTTPDDLISDTLELVFRYKKSEREKIQEQYIHQKQTEMMIGELLEKYIAEKGKDYGWAFTGECIKSVDFIKRDGDGWIMLQVKNSDNTENSSSKAVRDDTTIIKWHRRNSKLKWVKPTIKKDGGLSKRGLRPEEFSKIERTENYEPFIREFGTNWDQFPDKELMKELSEEGFKIFVEEHFHDDDEILADEQD